MFFMLFYFIVCDCILVTFMLRLELLMIGVNINNQYKKPLQKAKLLANYEIKYFDDILKECFMTTGHQKQDHDLEKKKILRGGIGK